MHCFSCNRRSGPAFTPHQNHYIQDKAAEPGPMPGCLASHCSSHAGRTAHGCQRGPTLVQHAQLMKANGAVLLAPCLTGVACVQARPMSRTPTL